MLTYTDTVGERRTCDTSEERTVVHYTNNNASRERSQELEQTLARKADQHLNHPDATREQ